MEIIEVTSWSQVPYDVALQAFVGDVEEVTNRFQQRYGYKCQVAYHLPDKWLLVIDKDFVHYEHSENHS
jgi:hypothetical protein